MTSLYIQLPMISRLSDQLLPCYVNLKIFLQFVPISYLRTKTYEYLVVPVP